MKNKYFIPTFSIIISFFFILSGIGKILNTGNFFNLLMSYGFGNFSYLAPLICIGEILFGLLFLLRIQIKKSAFLSLIVLTIFTIANTYAHFFKGINDCGCFGEINFLKSSYYVSLIRNIVFILISLVIYTYANNNTTPIQKWKIVTIFCITILSSIIAGFTINKPFIIHEPFLNKPIQETPLANYITTSEDSTYLIFVFSYSCSHCWNATENIKSYVETNTIDNVIGIAINNNERELFYSNLKPNFKIITMTKNSPRLKLNKTPITFFVKKNTVTIVKEGDVVSPYTFKQIYPDFFK